jgi:TfoX/Sxy family transcriptional regulator of competence genes
MAFDETLAERIRRVLAGEATAEERKMFGGLAFMVRGSMCCGVQEGRLVARVGREAYEEALAEPHVRPMDFTGRPLTGFVYVESEGIAGDEALAEWIERCLEFVRGVAPGQKESFEGALREPGRRGR